MRGVAGAVAVLALLPGSAAGQVPAPYVPQGEPAAAVNTPAMVVGGILTGGMGLVGGAALGASLERAAAGGCYDYCGLGGALIGGVLGEAVGIALGAHLGNDGRGSFAADLFTSIGVAAAGVTIAASLSEYEATTVPILLSIPAAQLASVLAVERMMSDRPSGGD